MKKLILLLMIGTVFVGCSLMYTTQNLSNSSKVTAGMLNEDVMKIMGKPVISELYNNVEEWHYCTTGERDQFLVIFFVENRVIAKKYYLGKDDYGDCSIFVKTGDYRIPSEVQEILDKN